MSGTAQQSSVPGDVPLPGGENLSGVETGEHELSFADVTNIWTLGVGSDRKSGQTEGVERRIQQIR